MSASRLLRFAGVALFVGGLLGLVGTLASPNDPDTRQQIASALYSPSAVLSLLGGLLTVVAFPGVYARIASRAGAVGLIGFVALMVTGALFGVFLPMASLVIMPWVAAQPIPDSVLQQGPPAFFAFFVVAGVIALAGAILFGIATIRTRIFARWIGYVLIAAGVVNLVTGFAPLPQGIIQNLGGALFYLALGAYGYQLWQASAVPAAGRATDALDWPEQRAA